MTQPYQFEEPGNTQGDRFSADDAQNRRLIIVPIEYVNKVRTSRGDEVDAIKLNVVDLQGGFNPQTGTEDPPRAYFGTLWFGGRLIGAFRNGIGRMFLGYVTKIPVQGGFKAWQFHSLTQDQQTTQLASAWLQANPEFMETCRSDAEMAQRNPTPQPAPAFQQGQAMYQQPVQQPQGQWRAQPQPGQQLAQPQYQAPAPPPGPAPMPGPAPIGHQAQPAPVQVQPPLPPPLSAPPAQQSPAPAPTSPAQPLPPPGGQTVMERLRAQREQPPTTGGDGDQHAF